ncbi:hypothetical protein NLM33_03885 [Bradyrhizobium sp. CCGUVB1N3]|uniref:hypothetical protein n=1 Tax=Bradyrhizobium sp. CCGUVB1N3 TaxID=2949629 RepID=UPI0020B19436|nr:hypothetical protein [Bradyrhizobium sp. CCGUVB1N3]MCP3469467.1 hypothetical protein [Bradyrhizobium sp. CCGUVB1N3]
MSSRALSLATVLLLIGLGAPEAAFAQATNLEAGKSPSQIFAQTCNACHKSPRGLLKSVPPGSLPGFLRQHYTTSSDMAGVLSSYLVSNGATDTRYQAKDGKDKKDGAKEKDKEANSSATQQPEHPSRRQHQDAAKPEGEGAPASETGRAGSRRMARPSEEGAKDGAKEGAKENGKPEGQATNERGPEGRKSKQRMSKRGKPEPEEAPKTDTPKGETPKDMPAAAEDRKSESKSDTKSDTKNDSAKVDTDAKPDSTKDKPAEKPADKPESAKVEPSTSQTPALRPDPVPQVTPPAPAAAKPAEAAPERKPADTAVKPADASSNGNGASAPQDAPATAAAPPAPVEPSGPPTPPLSR